MSKNKADWSKLTTYLRNLNLSLGQRILLTIDDIKEITGIQRSDRPSLDHIVEWSIDMANSPYKSIANAEFDVVRIELSLKSDQNKYNVVKFIEIEKVNHNPLDLYVKIKDMESENETER